MRWATEDVRMLLDPVPIPDGVTAVETEESERARPVFHLSDGRTVRRHPEWPYHPAAPKWIVEGREAKPAQTYGSTVAQDRTRAGRCPECGELPEAHDGTQEFWLRTSRCDLLPRGVADRIATQRDLDGEEPA